ncbi:unannotated protein [freshwater metagenome]|uniref:Unannotated protein n=1 Tax=freshwater metagenome TaxID=449393 RepID=A0A6J7RW64_9ZZZZ
MDAVIGYEAAQAIAADEVAITVTRFAHGDVGLGRMNAVDRSHQQIASRVEQRLGGGDLA